jgi:hypothetical protein
VASPPNGVPASRNSLRNPLLGCGGFRRFRRRYSEVPEGPQPHAPMRRGHPLGTPSGGPPTCPPRPLAVPNSPPDAPSTMPARHHSQTPRMPHQVGW